MNIGKVSENILKRSVLKLINDNFKDSAAEGSVCAFFTGYIADETGDRSGAYAIYRACNNAAVEGKKPVSASLTITMPENMREIRLKGIVNEAIQAAKETGIVIVDGHVETVEGIKAPIVIANLMAKDTDWKARKPKPGDKIIMTRWAAMSGAARLARKNRDSILERYPAFIVDDAIWLDHFYSIMKEAAVATKSDAICMNDCSDGGVFAALWQLADKNGVGLKVNLKDIPVRQESVEICEYFDINPYKLRSDGAMLIVTDKADEMLCGLHNNEINACVIGEICEGLDRIIVSGEDCRFLEEPRQDEGSML